MTREAIKCLDHGYVRFVEAWGHGDGGKEFSKTDGALLSYDMECGIIEAARQSTQASFRGWKDKVCFGCNGSRYESQIEDKVGNVPCLTCDGKGYLPGDQRLLSFLFNNKPQHATPFEFAGLVIEVRAPIFIFREWHRHRTQSYNEMSARYAPLPDVNYMPTPERCLMVSAKNKQAGAVKGSDEITHESALEWLGEVHACYEQCEKVYQSGLKRGVPKEVSRIVMPVGRYSQMRASANLRNWLAFVTLRSDPGAMWEIQQFSNAVGDILANVFPRTWKLFHAMRTK